MVLGAAVRVAVLVRGVVNGEVDLLVIEAAIIIRILMTTGVHGTVFEVMALKSYLA